MKAIVCRTLGGPELLTFDEVTLPPPGPAEVRIRIAGAGVNFPDLLQIAGKYQFKATPPFTPGAEVSGTVTAVGAKVSRLAVGDRVAALVSLGGYAEEVNAPAEAVLKLPDAFDLTEAAGFPLVYGTSMHALVQRGQLQAGETLLVLGAAGGVGLSAVQIGKRLGARVIAAASTEAKRALCRAHGADETIDYTDGALKDTIKTLTRGQGVDVVYDPVGGAIAQDAVSALAWRGRYLIVGFAAGTIPEIALNRLLLKGASAVGVFWGAFVAREPALNAENFQTLFRWHGEGAVRPVISATWPLAEAARALQAMATREATGKLVLLP